MSNDVNSFFSHYIISKYDSIVNAFFNFFISFFEIFGIIGTLMAIIVISSSKAICFVKTKHFYIMMFTADLIAIIWLNGLDKFIIFQSKTNSHTTLICKLVGCVDCR